jgi:cysteine desulfuration protein SufE
MRQDLQKLIEDFSFFEDWEDRYRYLIDLGKKLPPLDSSLMKEENLLRGCTSRVWMVIENQEGILHLKADSDAQIVKGLIAVVFKIYQAQRIEDVKHIDVDALFQQLGLAQHLSPNRRNGFFSMIEKINTFQA